MIVKEDDDMEWKIVLQKKISFVESSNQAL